MIRTACAALLAASALALPAQAGEPRSHPINNTAKVQTPPAPERREPSRLERAVAMTWAGPALPVDMEPIDTSGGGAFARWESDWANAQTVQAERYDRAAQALISGVVQPRGDW